MEQILARMPSDLEYMLPAMSVVHDYTAQVVNQIRNGWRTDLVVVTVEVGDESHLFLNSCFPRMEVIVREQEEYTRGEWDCILDFRDWQRPFRIAKDSKKHLTESWGIIFGASPSKIPTLGCLNSRSKLETLDILISDEFEEAEKLLTYMDNNHPEARTKIGKVASLRVGGMFDVLSSTKIYVGKRDGASYLAAAMGKGLVELYPTDVPLWWLSKGNSDTYKIIYGDRWDAETVFGELEEVWQDISNTRMYSEQLSGQQLETAMGVGI